MCPSLFWTQFNKSPCHHFIKIFPRLKPKRITSHNRISKLNVLGLQIQNLMLKWRLRCQKMRWLHRPIKDSTTVDWSPKHQFQIRSPKINKLKSHIRLCKLTCQDSYNWRQHRLHNPCLQTLRPWVLTQLRRVRFKTNASRLWTRSRPMKSGSTYCKGWIWSNTTTSSMLKRRYRSQIWKRLSKVLRNNWSKYNKKGTSVSNWC